MQRSMIVSALATWFFAGCGGAAPELMPPTSPTGWITVHTVTTGEDIPSPLEVIVEDARRGIGATASVTFASVAPGSRTVQLTGVSPYCTLSGGGARSVVVVAAETTSVAFEIRCPSVGPDRILVFIGANLFSFTEFGSRGIALTSSGQNFFAAISPDGTRIAFQSNRDGNDEIYVMNADGSNQVNVTNSPNTRDQWPRWSPDGQRLVFYSWATAIGPTSSEIYVIDAGGGAWQPLTSNAALDADPEWSPDGRRIAFMSERDGGDQELYVMNADGTAQTRLTNSPGADGNPSWSPDGRRLVFASARFGPADSYDIVLMNADGSGVTQLTDDPEIDVRPIWSPDGERILYSHRVARGNYDVWIMKADGSGQRVLITGPANEQADDWGIIR